MKIEVLNKFMDIFGDKADRKFEELKQFNKFKLYELDKK